MSSRPSPHPRPRPGPRPAPAAVADAPAGPTTTPASSSARRTWRASVLWAHPRTSQRGAIGVLFVAIGALVASGAGTSVAGVTAAPAAEHRAAVVRPATVQPMPAGPALAAAPGVTTKSTLKRKPTHAGTPAPVNHGVISGLAANGIPQVALNAYRVAAARMANVEPGCGIPWYLLAGIGREESDHGRFGGAVLHSDGVSTPAIIGPALDGKAWDFIPAPGNGLALDGDAKYAHALGPMQFIPSTWAGYGADANGDGRADIFNINDAALGAARYLCAAGGDLRTTAGKTRAVLTYNHNDQYLAQVLALAEAYRTGVPISGLPVGITKGALPKVADTGYIPPANPASPTAVDKTKHKTGSGPGHGKSTTPKPKPKPGGSTSTTPGKGGSTSPGRGSSSSAPSSSAPSSGSSTSSTPTPTPGSSASTPAPSPTKSCNPLEVVLGCKTT